MAVGRRQVLSLELGEMRGSGFGRVSSRLVKGIRISVVDVRLIANKAKGRTEQGGEMEGTWNIEHLAYTRRGRNIAVVVVSEANCHIWNPDGWMKIFLRRIFTLRCAT
jgi:hypothetical protein